MTVIDKSQYNQPEKPAISMSKPEDVVAEHLLEQYYQQNFRVAIFVVLGCVWLGVLAFGHIAMLNLALWGAAVVFFQGIHATLISKLQGVQGLASAHKLRLIALSNVVTSLVHSSILLLFHEQLPTTNIMIMVGVFMAFWAGGLGLCMGFLQNYMAYVLPTALLMLIVFFQQDSMGSAASVGTLFATVVYILYLVNIARDMYRLFSEAVNNRQQLQTLNGQMNEALREAESANASKTRFLASASHDLRQPLHALSLFSAALSMRKLDDGSREIASHMNKAVEALSGQLDSLLDISKLDAGLLEAHCKQVNLCSLLARLSDDFSNQVSQKGLTFDLEVPSEAWANTDPMLLERVLRNLLTNSLRYTESGGLTLKLESENGNHRIAVIDTGYGIPAAEQKRVFDEFYQLDNDARDRTKGLGLGLSIVHRLCSLLGVPLTLESTVGQGTTVCLELVAIGLPAAESPTVLQPSWSSQPITANVLVIDDEREVLAGMKTLLEGFGCQVQVATGSDGAVALTANSRFDVVLADFRLADGDSGLEAIERLRARQANLPAILISGDTAPERLKEAADAGMDMLHKPVPAKLLHQTLVSMLNS